MPIDTHAPIHTLQNVQSTLHKTLCSSHHMHFIVHKCGDAVKCVGGGVCVWTKNCVVCLVWIEKCVWCGLKYVCGVCTEQCMNSWVCAHYTTHCSIHTHTTQFLSTYTHTHHTHTPHTHTHIHTHTHNFYTCTLFTPHQTHTHTCTHLHTTHTVQVWCGGVSLVCGCVPGV